jgi:hypothetical protein
MPKTLKTEVKILKSDPPKKDLLVQKKPWYILKDSRGLGSITVTLVLVSFWVTTVAYIGSMFNKIGDIEFREFDPAAVSAYLIPILSLYFGRKWTDLKMSQNQGEKNENIDQ